MSFFSKSGVLTKIIQMSIELHSSIIDEMGVVVVVDGSLAELRSLDGGCDVSRVAGGGVNSYYIQVLC